MENQVKPEVGMGVTFCIGSDRYPYTISRVVSDRQIEVQEDDYYPAPNHNYFGGQSYIYSRNPFGIASMITLRKNGRWIKTGETMNSSGFWRIGVRDAYQDPSF